MRTLAILLALSAGCTSWSSFGRGVSTANEVARDVYIAGAIASTLAAVGVAAVDAYDQTIYDTSSPASCDACPPNEDCFYVDFTCPRRR